MRAREKIEFLNSIRILLRNYYVNLLLLVESAITSNANHYVKYLCFTTQRVQNAINIGSILNFYSSYIRHIAAILLFFVN